MRGWRNNAHVFSDKQQGIVSLVLKNYLRDKSGTPFWSIYKELKITGTAQSLQCTLRALENRGLTRRDPERIKRREEALVFPTDYLLENYQALGFNVVIN